MTHRIRVPEVGPIDLVPGLIRLREPSPFDGRAWSRLRVDDADRLAARHEGLVPVDGPQRWVEVNQSGNWMAVQRLAIQRVELGLGFSWVIDLDNRFAGQIELTGLTQAPHRAARVGAWVGRQFASRGIASAALALALDHGFGSAGVDVVEAVVDRDNEHSERGLLSMGFRQVEAGRRLRSTWESVYPPDPDANIFEITHDDLPAGVSSFVDHAMKRRNRRTRDTTDNRFHREQS
ncbi:MULTISPECIES: GNAT family N-acetyltransferase [Gordonia]|uniref:GNAT family N-acetyltransferase n=1 Tax=Gordonia TaxID=2053 RepID=UPI0001DD94D0|nr:MULTISPECIES: GNAT family N-acetyltransferase [Gordonia]ADK68991.1 Acetyltransferases, including N-acetylases of ribosomal proteins [Gordonia sp. KTR9]MCZ4580487.1 GNAT family N-acetyltransferase [Gordonia amicalis]